jgi:hypothetical protein
MAYTSNAATLTFGEYVLGVIRSISIDGTGKEIDLTGLGDSEDVFECGTLNNTVTAECYGSVGIDIGDADTLTVSLNGVATTLTGDFICSQASPTARLNEPKSVTYKFVQTTATT